MNTLQQFYIGNFYTDENNQLLSLFSPLITDTTAECADHFYDVLLSDPKSQPYISNELVEVKLKAELQKWILQTLTPKMTPEARVEIVQTQRHVGAVHTRVDVPMSLVNCAMNIIKQVLYQTLSASPDYSDSDKLRFIPLMDQLLDASLSLINESYMEGHLQNERTAQEFRSHSTAQELAIEIERIKGDFYGWLSQFMGALLFENPSSTYFDIHQQDFALWIRHKLNFVCAESSTTQKIQANLTAIQSELTAIKNNDPEHRNQALKTISDLTKESGWMLSQIANANIETSTREDSLTFLIERRFLDPILQNESQMAMRTETPFSLMMIDIDDFKHINDIHGHQAGDEVLSMIGRLLKNALRVTDYAFRYGGEEFLILLPETNLENAQKAAVKMLDKVRKMIVSIRNGRQLKVTISIGIAEFDGHPDYERTIALADEKLYQTKHNGKDGVTI
ncbi:hypothetical protein CYQ88_10240 [Hydrogenovibrio sp. SC-1]|uniref:GGDEF domain-containing protein n=1 Tax=Hydrogenovibrio sp. SC-1 TaxID=2065820 RepID=UPI000C7E4918|nr:GGDEF domain-containing protein [Hydrogenovibrio sp. SC-1]PLA73633.1 hypothetical protein CYQ88_10240 [Hydrogenovibrio sp. SC-1]